MTDAGQKVACLLYTSKTIQKAVESYRITPEQKDELRSLRWKDCAKEEGV